MDEILREKFHMKPTTHDGRLYKGTLCNDDILFFQQIDNFTVATKNETTARELIRKFTNICLLK